MRHRLIANAIALVAISTAFAAQTSADDQAAIKAAIVVSTFDRLEAGCTARGGYAAAQRAEINDWQRRNAVNEVRAYLPALQRNPQLAQQLVKSADQIVQAVRSKGANDCAAAVSISRLPDAQFGHPALDTRTAGAAVPPTTVRERRGDGASMVASAVDPAIVAEIDAFGFATRPKMGLGGFVALDIYPVVLFKSGEALKDVAGLRAPGGPAAHRRAHPDQWTRWRHSGDKVQLLGIDKWENTGFKTYARLPAGLRLAGKFRNLGGTGNIAVGGSQSVTVVDEYRFASDGSVVHSGAVGGRAEAGDTSVVTAGGPRERQGRYRMDGLLLQIDYDDGEREQRILITDPENPGGTLWLDGVAYVERR